MHLRGCYDFFRPPRTKYEIWRAAHEKKRRKREEEEAKLADQEMVALSKMCSLALYQYRQQYQAIHQPSLHHHHVYINTRSCLSSSEDFLCQVENRKSSV